MTKILENVEEWRKLWDTDPVAFEEARRLALRQEVDKFAETCTPETLAKLEGLLFKIEMTRQKAKNPLHSAVLSHNLMWDSFLAMNEALQEFSYGKPQVKTALPEEAEFVRVIDFSHAKEARQNRRVPQ